MSEDGLKWTTLGSCRPNVNAGSTPGETLSEGLMASEGNGENGMGLVEIGEGLFHAGHGEQVAGPSRPCDLAPLGQAAVLAWWTPGPSSPCAGALRFLSRWKQPGSQKRHRLWGAGASLGLQQIQPGFISPI